MKIKHRISATFTEWSTKLQDHEIGRYLPQILMGLVLVISVTLMFPSGQSFQFGHFKEGDVHIGEQIIAPFTFDINKTESEIARDRKNATEKVPLVFMRSDSVQQTSLNEFNHLFHKIDSIRVSAATDSIKIENIGKFFDTYSIIIEKNVVPYFLQNKWIDPVDSTKKRHRFADIVEAFKTILIDVHAIGVLNLLPEEIPKYVSEVSVISTEGETVKEIKTHFNAFDYPDAVLEKLRQKFPRENTIVPVGYSIILSALTPNLIYDDSETERRKEEAIATVPIAKGFVLKDVRIVNPHEIITRDIVEKLNSLAAAKSERESISGGVRIIYPYLGKILVVCLSLSFLVLFLITSRPEIFNHLRKMLMIFVIFMFILTVTFLINQFGFSSNLKYLIPISIAAMLMTIFFDTRTAFVGTVVLSIIIGALRGNEFGIMIISLFVGSISTFSVREIQARSWLLKAMLSISSTYFIAIAAVELLKSTAPGELWQMWALGILNGVCSPILTYGLMIFFEYAFKFTTNSTLLELSDLNKPLLRQLAIRAPGTYHHSIMVGNLSEAAAEAINANALLARVASYYHDIGKMEKPEYFVENQKGGKNPHEKLTPNMSCLILINHVKKGLEIAKQYNLPKEIRDFIPEHHGTNLIQFFYSKAKENGDGQEINEADFRYHGPKPQSKETGIVMLADAVEAGSRTLRDPSVSRIRSMVNAFAAERLAEAELDECPLTLRDINLIKKSFVNNLTGMFHGRIEYPDNKKSFLKSNFSKK